MNNFVISKLVEECTNLQSKDDVLVLHDFKTDFIATQIYKYILQNKNYNTLNIHSVNNLSIHGDEPDPKTNSLIKSSSLIFCLTSFSLAHTITVTEVLKSGAKFLSLPDFSADVFTSKAFNANFKSYREACFFIADILTNSKNIKVTSLLGTDIQMTLTNRKSNPAPGCVIRPGDLSSPPDIECNIAPIEYKTNGILVIDGSVPIPSIGILKNPIKIIVEDGICKKIDGYHNDVDKLNEKLTFDKNRRTVGEFGIGLNPYSKIVGRMLEDEGAFNTCHFGVGANTTIGGSNKCNGHIDLVMKNPIFEIDNSLVDIFKIFKSKIK